MAIDRPTFSETWYRVADLKPRLRATIHTYRQFYRGQAYHIVHDPASNQFFRLPEPAYRFVGMLDGKRAVKDVWEACNEQLGDDAPTQNEATQLLGQLYASNLLSGDVPADARGMFERYHKRVTREVRGYLSNLLFVRIPLIDPEPFLVAWSRVFGWLFSWVGLVLWLAILGVGGWALVGKWDELYVASNNVLDPSNFIWLYIAFAINKVFHEFGHGFACKRFGIKNGSGGEVHTMGIMFLVFFPVPYVDASSAWAFRSKWQRAVVGAAGMFVELAIAGVAAVIWANTAPGSTVNAIAYNMIFVASISTILFNGNPLLRYDGYYILSDLLEIPNLSQRSKEYLYYLVKKYVYGVRRPHDPSHSGGERFWLFVYAIASTIYRIFISIVIVLFITDRLPKELAWVALLLAAGAIVTWVFVPLWKFIKYLWTSPELARTRQRALLATGVVVAAIIIGIGLIPAPEYGRAPGFVEPRDYTAVFMEVDGRVQQVRPSGEHVSPEGEPLVIAENEELLATRQQLEYRYQEAKALADKHYASNDRREIAKALDYDNQARVLKAQMDELDGQIDSLHVKPDRSGIWVSPQGQRLVGQYLPRGEQIGALASRDRLFVRVIADQSLGPRIAPEVGAGKEVEIRIEGRPDVFFTGTIEKIYPAGNEQLPSAALGYAAGGSIETELTDQGGTKATEPFFEVVVDPHLDEALLKQLNPGQRVIVRFKLPNRPLAVQWWRSLLQLFQRKFRT